MKPFSEAKVTIIGLGFLMEYIFPCFRRAMGERAAAQLNAVTADAGDLEGKRRRLGISVLLNDNAGALRELEPDWIFFAPPPSVAPELVENCLRPYFDGLRGAGKPVPALVAFPPSPAGAFYQEKLGEDLKVVNIIPNMISRVGEEDVSSEACHLITYPARDNWTLEEKAELGAFLSPMGRRLELTPELTLHVLSAEIATHPLTELADAAARRLTARGVPCTYQEAAGCMRAFHQKARGYTAPGTNHCALDEVKDPAAVELLGRVTKSWYEGLRTYLTGRGFDAQRAQRLLDPLFDLYFHEAQLESRETLLAKARKDATPGGMLELCMERYRDVVEPRLEALFSQEGTPEQAGVDEIGELMALITGAVVERGRGLTAVKAPSFGPGQHAVMFGVLARAVLDEFGAQEGDGLLLEAVSRYGEERGRRMAARCARDGVEPDMAAYFAYGEWTASQGFEKSGLLDDPHRHYQVLQCPWCAAWDRTGLGEYGKYYCRCVDRSILRGFHPALRLELPAYHTMPGGTCCDFHWKDAPRTDDFDRRRRELAERVGTSCVKDFLFHTAHLYQTLTRCAKARDGAKGRAAEQVARRDFAALCSHQELLRVLAAAQGDLETP
ncbi:MAG: L-2-amino-thiazoline-4-carboxylic acid hydrolase [Oscillospiraceae bacterium]|nr:L-2-amino-thiazoline-4-carboxylic acid hydrolase [Oscillospiraceae bacterium]MCI9548500.1 L-2-amino-thiazoline-4-carboxylic acid hydrolase [Oscillospiraceae bacterium]